MELTTIVGACGSVLSFVLFLPQARHTWVNRHRAERLAGISSLGQVCVLANATVWAVYGVLADAVWAGAPGLLNAPLAIGTLWLLHRRHPQKSGEACEACETGTAHRVFITSPPGWGSVMPCSAITRRSGVLVFSDEDIRVLRDHYRAHDTTGTPD